MDDPRGFLFRKIVLSHQLFVWLFYIFVEEMQLQAYFVGRSFFCFQYFDGVESRRTDNTDFFETICGEWRSQLPLAEVTQ